jgi:UDP-N-acetylmuramyl-tripeptide synthetase
MRLSELVNISKAAIAKQTGDPEVLRPIADTRKVQPGDLFFCMPSVRTDTHALISEARAKGATAVVLHNELGSEHAVLPFVLPAGGQFGFNEAAWRLSHTLLGYPSRALKVIGVTGTNGKTTTSWLLRDLLCACGMPAAYLGTLGYQDEVEAFEIGNTTPFAVDLANLIELARSHGSRAFSMEVSSHALNEQRADGVEFDAAVFTNLTQDHLDYHGSMDSYAEAKWRLFNDLPLQSTKAFAAALNVDDPIGAEWAARSSRPVIRYSLNPQSNASLVAEALDIKLDRHTLRVKWRGENSDAVEVPLGGGFNVINTVSAVAGMLALGFRLDKILPALAKVRPVPGRFEAVPNSTGLGIIVDYAHTPDALIKLLDAVKALNPGKIYTVFGCGGDRDRTKRPIMARAASERSDVSVVTSDNPRTEDPGAILAEVASGIASGRESVQILDRKEAVAYAISHARPGDAVVIAGKGHENYQIIGHTKHPMDDRDLARSALEALV